MFSLIKLLIELSIGVIIAVFLGYVYAYFTDDVMLVSRLDEYVNIVLNPLGMSAEELRNKLLTAAR